MSLKASFVSFLNLKYPSLDAALLDSVISDRLISPFQVTLSSAQVVTIKAEIKKWGAETYTRKVHTIDQEIMDALREK